ncbi:MAG TPA: response regulator transcription factor [Candidatus Sulfomarinibacteraceae bacterium]|nr:response regulator transcription factor [Candidatus Sulfomarinibacteraceae bacterium]
MSAPLRVIVADDHEAVREGLRWMLRADDAVEVVGEARDGQALLGLLDAVACDAVLLDLAMPGMSGLDVLAALHAAGRSLPIVVLTMHDDASHVDRALALGASGYVLKSAPRDEIIRALRAATSGGAYVQPSLAKPLLARHIVADASGVDEHPIQLSPRQLQLLRALAAGGANKELAHELGISEATVKGYLKDLYVRLGVRSRAGAVGYGLRHGLIR